MVHPRVDWGLLRSGPVVAHSWIHVKEILAVVMVGPDCFIAHIVVFYNDLRCGAYGTFCYGIS